MSDTRLHTPYDFGAAITQAFKLPGGLSFLFRVAVSTALILVLIYTVFGKALIAGYIELFNVILAMEGTNSGEPSPEALGAMVEQMFSLMGPAILLWLGSWVTLVSAETAMHKNVFHGTDNGLFPLRFGVPELRVMLAKFVVGLIGAGIYMAGYLFFILLVLLAAFGAQAHVILGVILGIIAAAGFVAWIGAMLLAYVRLAPAAAMSVRDDDVRTIEGWHITKKRFWPMLGSYLVVGIIGYTILMVPLVLILAVFGGALASFGDFANLESEDPAIVLDQIWAFLAQPSVIIGMIVIGVISAVLSVVYYMALWGIANYVTQIDDTRAENDVFA